MVGIALIFVALGFIGGLAAGVLGFGGGVLMFPLLYFVPPMFGVERLDANTVAAIVVSQVFFSTLSGGVAHSRTGRVNWRIAFIAGATSAVGSFIGGLASKWLPEKFLLLLFGIVTLAVAGMMFLTGPDPDQQKRAGRQGHRTGFPVGFVFDPDRNNHRSFRRGKFPLRTALNLLLKSSDSHRHRQQSLHRYDEYCQRVYW